MCGTLFQQVLASMAGRTMMWLGREERERSRAAVEAGRAAVDAAMAEVGAGEGTAALAEGSAGSTASTPEREG